MSEPDIDAQSQEEGNQILAEVFVYAGGVLLQKYAIEHGEYIIGRDATCHIIVDADQVSRHHARLTFNAFELVIEDLGSSNGVFIDGVQVQLPTRIRLDQEVQIGSARLQIRLKESAAKQLAAALWDKDLGLAPVREQLEGKKYKVITTLARGGMGVILQARDLRIRRTVAMKVMKTGSQFSRENVLRFIDEAQLTGQLEHPNIVPVYELAIDEQGETFYTMKFVKGITLDDVLRGIRGGNERMIERYPLGTLLTIFQKVCDAVAFAHAKGVVHRDLKPENIMIGSFGEVLVMDWGLAKNMLATRRETSPEAQGEGVSVVAKFDDLRGFETMNGLIVGTPPYISPEQARGELENIDPRSDIYVLGAILYAILTLRPHVEADSVNDVVERILGSQIVSPSHFNNTPKSGRSAVAQPADTIVFHHCPGRRIPDGLSAVAMKALQLKPEDRYQSVEDLQADVSAFQGGFAPKAERATVVKHAALFAVRHKREVAIFALFATLLLAAVIAFFLSLTKEKNRALASEQMARRSAEQLQAAVAELRGTAPTFYEDAKAHVQQRDLESALEKIEYAIRQVPNEAEYRLLNGNILQAMLRWEDAIDAYEEALRLNPNLKAARENLALTTKLMADAGAEREPEAQQIKELAEALTKQRRLAEATVVAQKLTADARPLKLLKETIDSSPEWKPFRDLFRGERFRKSAFLTPDGTWTVDLRGRPLDSVLPFLKSRPIPITGLVLDEVAISDLSVLEGLPLKTLSLSGCTSVSDLTPLAGLPLERLVLRRTAVTDLAPLTGLPLKFLSLEGCQNLASVGPVLGMANLETLILPRGARDIESVRGSRSLKNLDYRIPARPAVEFWREYDRRKEQVANAPETKDADSVTDAKAPVDAVASPSK